MMPPKWIDPKLEEIKVGHDVATDNATRRDEWANIALRAACEYYLANVEVVSKTLFVANVGTFCYSVADSMLKARNGGAA